MTNAQAHDREQVVYHRGHPASCSTSPSRPTCWPQAAGVGRASSRPRSRSTPDSPYREPSPDRPARPGRRWEGRGRPARRPHRHRSRVAVLSTRSPDGGARHPETGEPWRYVRGLHASSCGPTSRSSCATRTPMSTSCGRTCRRPRRSPRPDPGAALHHVLRPETRTSTAAATARPTTALTRYNSDPGEARHGTRSRSLPDPERPYLSAAPEPSEPGVLIVAPGVARALGRSTGHGIPGTSAPAPPRVRPRRTRERFPGPGCRCGGRQAFHALRGPTLGGQPPLDVRGLHAARDALPLGLERAVDEPDLVAALGEPALDELDGLDHGERGAGRRGAARARPRPARRTRGCTIASRSASAAGSANTMRASAARSSVPSAAKTAVAEARTDGPERRLPGARSPRAPARRHR